MCARFTVLSDTPIAARNRRLGHPTLTQQHHLDALALRRRYLPAQRSFQPPPLGFAAFDHLFSPNQMAQANHTSGEENSPRLSAKNPDSSRYGGSIRRGEVSGYEFRACEMPLFKSHWSISVMAAASHRRNRSWVSTSSSDDTPRSRTACLTASIVAFGVGRAFILCS